MIRASAKNFIRVASVVDPADYGQIVRELKQNGGKTSIADYLGARTANEAAGSYQFQDK